MHGWQVCMRVRTVLSPTWLAFMHIRPHYIIAISSVNVIICLHVDAELIFPRRGILI